MVVVAAAQKQEDLIDALFQALVNDGFIAYCCGPKDRPTAVICVYEWSEHFDVLTLRVDGPAAAARLVKPADALNPPDTGDDNCVWAWVGEPDGAMWALLDLPHPARPEAPTELIRTPEALRISREEQRPMRVRVPDEGKAGTRAARLLLQEPKVMGERFFNDLLDEVDSKRAAAFASYFTKDGTLRWGNFEPVVGRLAITEFTEGFFSLIVSVRHDVDDYWQVEGDRTVTTGRVTFTRHEGSEVTVPFMTLSLFTPDGTKMIHYQVCLDPSPVLMPQPQH
jgi:hypothetical protein